MKLPIGVSSLINVMDSCGWTYTITHGSGHMDAQTFGPPRGDGTRPKLTIQAPVVSIAVRARHEATGRQVRALFVCRTDKAKRAWTMTTAWRGAHGDRPCASCVTGGCGTTPDSRLRPPCATCMGSGCGGSEHAPHELTATEVKAYVIDVQLAATEPDRAAA